MSPAAVAVPRFAPNPLSGAFVAKDSFGQASSEASEGGDWNNSINNMDNSLDFDLLAEYLLDDGGMSGFDFIPDAASPVTDRAPNSQAAQEQSPGVVTPHQADVSFADPLADAVEQMKRQQGQPGGVASVPPTVDLAGELAQVQQRIAQPNQASGESQVIPGGASNGSSIAPPQLRPTNDPVIRIGQPMMVMPQLTPSPAGAQTAPAPSIQQPVLPNSVTMPSNKRPRIDVKEQKPIARPPNRTNGSNAPPVVSFAPANHVNQLPKIPYPFPASHQPPHPSQSQLPNHPASSRQKSQAQIDRRRERNRILARRTRLRKKFFFESLQKDVADLQRENAALKSIVRTHLKPEDAKKVLEKCNANEKLPSVIHEPVDENGVCVGMGAGIPGINGKFGMAFGGEGDVKQLDKEDFSLIQSIQNSQQCFVITDPSLHDNPIVYASDDFLNLTGYSQEEVLGRNCRFLQGTGTDPEKVAIVRKAVGAGEDINVTMVNYTSDGTPFWNSLFIAALRDAENNIVNFIGVIVKVAGPEPSDKEYGKVLTKEK